MYRGKSPMNDQDGIDNPDSIPRVPDTHDQHYSAGTAKKPYFRDLSRRSQFTMLLVNYWYLFLGVFLSTCFLYVALSNASKQIPVVVEEVLKNTPAPAEAK